MTMRILLRVDESLLAAAALAVCLWAGGFASARADVIFNEVMADNQTAFQNGEDFPNWIELYNDSTTTDVSLSGWSFTDNPTRPRKWVFPNATKINRQARLFIYCDGLTNSRGLHASISLSAAGETLMIFDNLNTNTPHATLTFGLQVADHSLARIPDLTGPFVLAPPTPGAPNVTAVPLGPVSSLKINEWLVTLAGKDWFELYNPSPSPVLLSGLILSDQTNTAALLTNRPVPALAYVAAGGFVRFWADSLPGADHVDFKLSDAGDHILLFATDKTTAIDRVDLGTQSTELSLGRVPDGSANIVTMGGRTPGQPNFGLITSIVINEVLTHTDLPLEDAIELHNVTTDAVDISHWWLTDDTADPFKFRIPAGTVIAASGFKVFYEGIHASFGFNRTGLGQAPNFSFSSSKGDDVWLFAGQTNGALTGFRCGVAFGPAANGVSFGRYLTSDGTDFAPMTARTFGADVPATVVQFRTGAGGTNAGPKVGPIVINEIMYQPPEVIQGTNRLDDTLNEFIELCNLTHAAVPLYDPDFPTNRWRVRGGVSFDFTNGVTLAADSCALLVSFNPQTNASQLANFRLLYDIADEVPIYGPYRGKLSNGSDHLDLQRPDPPQTRPSPNAGFVPHFLAETISYRGSAAWTTNAEATGRSLQRLWPRQYGNEPTNWAAASPTPGKFNTPSGVEPPSISAQPGDVAAFVAGAASIIVSANGGQLTYHWLFHGTNLPGHTTSRLDLANLSTNRSGPYQVIITNIAGAVTSRVAILTVSEGKPDTTRPAVSITSPTAPVTTNELIVATGKASDDIGIGSVFYSVNGGAFLTATGSVTYSVWGTPEPITLTAGTNIIRAYSQDHAAKSSLTNQRSYFLSVRTPLTLVTNGGVVRGATNTQLLEVGRNFLLTAVPRSGFVFSNWIVISNLSVVHTSSQPTLTYMMASNLAITANFVANPYGPITGKYNGLFYDTNEVLHRSSGFFTLAITERGTYTAALLTGGLKLSASGQLSVEGQARNTIIRKGTNALTVEWDVALDGSDRVAGTVSDGSWLAPLNGDRATFTKTHPCTLAGKYTLLLPGLPGDSFVPGGTSYGFASVDSNGVVIFKGFLSDQTSAAQKVPLSKNGEWPLYVPLYSGKGSLLSWIAFTNQLNDDFHGVLNWSKPALPTAKYYALGFTTNETTLIGARYTPPAGTNKILHLTAATLTLQGVNLVQNYTNDFTLGLSSKVTNGGPHALKLSFTPATGMFKGSLTPTNTKAITFAGAILQKGTNAGGFSLGTNQSARVMLQRGPASAPGGP